MYRCKDNVIITIGRSFGSGGKEIGRKVAEQLEIPFYDKKLLEIEAKESGGAFFVENLSEYDEKPASGFLASMAFDPYGDKGSLDAAIQSIQTKAINAVAAQGSCIIVGRRADKVLSSSYDILSIFVSASMEKRIARVSAREGLPEKESKKKIIKMDKIRKSYYNSWGEGDWGEASNYNLCIDSGDLGIDNSAALILEYLKLKGRLE